MKFSLKWFWVLSVAALMCVPLPAQGQFSFDENPLIQKQAPDFTLNSISGETMSLNKYRENDLAIIFFWATWCPHCRTEMRALAKQAADLQEAGIKIALVNVGESPRLVKAFVDKIKLPFPVFLDEQSLVSEQYSIIGLPTLFFVDGKGVIIAMEHGLPDNFVEILSAASGNK